MTTTVLRVAAAGLGVILIGYGVTLTIRSVAQPDWRSMIVWLAGGVLGHDAVLAPLWLGMWWMVRRSLRGRAYHVPVAVGLAFTAVLALLAVPVLAPRPNGQRPVDNPTLLDRPYGLGLLITLALVWAAVIATIAVGRLRATHSRRRTHTDADVGIDIHTTTTPSDNDTEETS
ncbi:hypothetical protein ACPXB3_05450 [Gordonia sp. DT219]|uniref:hypothetical protein n=1 Tax=Gordonia sp. DT219 TaxID=3416658 RepID=UPI003CED6BCD